MKAKFSACEEPNLPIFFFMEKKMKTSKTDEHFNYSSTTLSRSSARATIASHAKHSDVRVWKRRASNT